MIRFWRESVTRALAIGGACAALLLTGAGIAAADVHVDPGIVTAGGYASVSFKVPSDSGSASTTSVQIQIPPATPFPSVSVGQMAGWTSELAESDLPTPVTQGSVTFTHAVTSVTFTAQDGGIGPREFASFDVLVGPVPDVGSISFTVVQTYSDGTIVRWDQPTAPGAGAPDYPAPTIQIAEADATSGVSSSDSTTANDDGQLSTTVRDDTDGIARLLGAAAIMLALVAIGVGVNRRRPPASPVPNSVLIGSWPARKGRSPEGDDPTPASQD